MRHILAKYSTTVSFGCASSVPVSDILQEQQQVLKEKQIATVIAHLEMLSCQLSRYWRDSHDIVPLSRVPPSVMIVLTFRKGLAFKLGKYLYLELMSQRVRVRVSWPIKCACALNAFKYK